LRAHVGRSVAVGALIYHSDCTSMKVPQTGNLLKSGVKSFAS
jgi:hypothetical protein